MSTCLVYSCIYASGLGFILPIRTVPGGLNFYRSGTRERIEPLNIGSNNPLGIQMEEQRRKAIRENFPGPGNYKINSDLRESTPSYKFGSQSRDRKNTNITPGPGQYHIPYTMMDVPRYLSTGGGFNDQFRYI